MDSIDLTILTDSNIDQKTVSSTILVQGVENFRKAKSILKPKALDSVKIVGASSTIERKDLLACSTVLKSEGLITFRQLGEEPSKKLLKNLKLAGFSNLEKQVDGTFHSTKITWNKTKLTQKPVTKKANPFAIAKKAENELIDDETLLKNDLVEKGANIEDCSTKPKACKDCSCGRKEEEERLEGEALIKQIEEGNVSTACGNCYLGDAFRCPTCPYKGLPAFLPGEKIKLNVDDVPLKQNVEESKATTVVKEGAVKIDL